MPHPHDEDLFEGTKMSFGEHLEELRSSLFKAVIALGLGFVVGLLIGNWVVQWIKHPVEQALQDYYTQQAIDEYVADLNRRDLPVPEDLDELKQMMLGQRLIGEPAYISAVEIFRDLKQQYPDQFAELQVPNIPPDEVPLRKNMLRVFLWKPIATSSQGKLVTLNAPEGFMIYIKASLIAGVVIASPFIFYFIWNFVGAGLYPHERSYVHVFMPMSIFLFLAGAGLAFFFVFQYVLDFLFGFNQWLGLEPDLRISEWLSFVLLLPVGFGLSFQLPLVMLFLERIGVFTVDVYLEKWRIAVLAIAIISMVLTPAEPTSMMLMMGPLVVLYFGGIVLCRFLPKGRSPYAELD